MKTKNLLVLIAAFSCLTACSQTKKGNASTGENKLVLLSPSDFNKKMQTEKGIIIDVRTPGEYKKGHLKEARLLDIFADNFEAEIDKLDKNATYYVYCQGGGRSGEATELMHKKGFKTVYDMEGGFSRWKAQNLPFE